MNDGRKWVTQTFKNKKHLFNLKRVLKIESNIRNRILNPINVDIDHYLTYYTNIAFSVLIKFALKINY